MSKADKQTILNSSVEMIHEYYDKEHKRNKDRIKYGIIAMAIIPIVFLILLFVVNSSKVVFLVMWIASLFIISGYLIAIEYKDYNMTENLKGIVDNSETDTLIDTTKVIKDIAMNYARTEVEEDEYENDGVSFNNENYEDENCEEEDNNDYIDIQAVNDIYDENIVDNKKQNTHDINTNPSASQALNNINNAYTGATPVNPADCQNITIDNRINNNTITISIDNKTSAINITINPNKEAGR